MENNYECDLCSKRHDPNIPCEEYVDGAYPVPEGWRTSNGNDPFDEDQPGVTVEDVTGDFMEGAELTYPKGVKQFRPLEEYDPYTFIQGALMLEDGSVPIKIELFLKKFIPSRWEPLFEGMNSQKVAYTITINTMGE